MGRFCRTCNVPTDIIYEESLGHVVCKQCGGVMEENAIVAEVTFSEKSNGAAIADGFQVQSGAARARSRAGKFGMQRAGQESRETTIQNGHRKISEIANIPQIRMNSRHVEAAQRYFNLAVINNFTKGRKLQDVSAACLYIVCRMEKTAHMLIDFADALNVNVYVLGHTFVRLRDILHLTIPIVDPALYISRFAARLDFEDSTQQVIRDANRLVQRMNRDWLHLGRRPAGICAACLYIAARMHGFNRTPREIVLQVKICEATLKNRLAEFSQTPSAQLSVEDFSSIWLDRAEDPPAFARHQTKRHIEGGEAGEDGEEETDSVNANGKRLREDGAEAGSGSNKRRKPSENGISNGIVNGEDEQDMETLVDEVQNLINTDAALTRTTRALEGTPINNDEDLDTLDDDPDVREAITTDPDEIKMRTDVWTLNNQDWEAKQLTKAKLEKSGNKARKPRQKKPPRNYSGATPAEATRNLVDSKPRMSKKINYEVMESLFEVDEDKLAAASRSKSSLKISADSVTGFGTVSVEHANGGFEEEFVDDPEQWHGQEFGEGEYEEGDE
ncbi:transcription factor TFIIIB subunit brf1 [Rhizophlyctis rosea]|nr:transcription factor TFIIIB subunit brf1 [Rhizophlyctis rosea]